MQRTALAFTDLLRLRNEQFAGLAHHSYIIKSVLLRFVAGLLAVNS